jgi:hypothetical protein
MEGIGEEEECISEVGFSGGERGRDYFEKLRIVRIRVAKGRVYGGDVR